MVRVERFSYRSAASLKQQPNNKLHPVDVNGRKQHTMRTILIDSYISLDPTAKEAITDFSKNKLIIKGSTGIGGTAAILGITDKNVIIISPYVGMIQSKEDQNTEPNIIFIYQNSSARWKDVEEKLNNNEQFILNTTQDQILNIESYNKELFYKIRQIPLFIDESHVASEVDYRPSLAKFNHMVVNDWQNHITFSTATPIFQNIDIPFHIREHVEIIRIERQNEPIKGIAIYPYKLYANWVYQELGKGRKVVVFTNDQNIYKRFLQDPNIKTQPLVGDKLKTKIATFKESKNINLTNKLDENNQLFILSTKFVTGFDVPFDASVGIISNENDPTDVRYINEIVQAYGRVRKQVNNAAIFYRRQDRLDFTNENEIINKFQANLKNPNIEQMTYGQANHTLVLAGHLKQKLRQQTYNSPEELAENLKEYGFSVLIETIDINAIEQSGMTISNRIQNLLTYEPSILKNFAEYVFKNIQGDNENYNGYGEYLIIIYAAAIIASSGLNPWLEDKIKKARGYKDFVWDLKAFIDVNTLSEEMMAEGYQDWHPERKVEKIRASEWYQNAENDDDIIKFRVPMKAWSCAKKAGAESPSFQKANQKNLTLQKAVYLINTFFVIHMVEHGELDEETLQGMSLNSIISEKVREDYLSGVAKIAGKPVEEVLKKIQAFDGTINGMMTNRPVKSMFRHTFEKIIRHLSYEPTTQQQMHIKNKMDGYISYLEKTIEDSQYDQIKYKLENINYSIPRQKELHRNYLLGLASLHISGDMAGFRSSKKNYREYNVVTKVPKILRYITPYHMVEVDICSANAQIIDKLFGTTVAMQVYYNLQDNGSISREEAKIKYNSTVNNNRLPVAKAKEVYLKAGYSLAKAEYLAEWTTSQKVYGKMCQVEEDMVYKYQSATNCQNAIRCHDGFVMMATEYNTRNLPTCVNGVRYRINYH